jgi:threonyl-tRNA synthetase
LSDFCKGRKIATKNQNKKGKNEKHIRHSAAHAAAAAVAHQAVFAQEFKVGVPDDLRAQ